MTDSPTQPPSAETLRDFLALNLVAGLGPRLQTLLLERFDSPAAILNASSAELLAVPRIGRKIVEELRLHNHRDMARRELEECRLLDVELVTQPEETYPASLREIPDPPLVLYQQGMLQPVDQLAVAIVGSRNCTSYGRRLAEQLSAGLARAGMTIVSGLARGIDGFAHRAALQAGGRTIAVCASGLKHIYPSEHQNLAREIAAQGAVLSESPLNCRPTRGLFPQRNRIVSGLCLGVVVIEASRTSGTLHTARHAMEQGREVFAVPGPIDSRESDGCHALIRDGVKLVRGVDDILEDLTPLINPLQTTARHTGRTVSAPALNSTPQASASAAAQPVREVEIRTPRELNLTEQQSTILNLLHETPVLVDTVIEQSGLEPSRVLSTLTILEMKRLVQRLPGNQLLRVPR